MKFDPNQLYVAVEFTEEVAEEEINDSSTIAWGHHIEEVIHEFNEVAPTQVIYQLVEVARVERSAPKITSSTRAKK